MHHVPLVCPSRGTLVSILAWATLIAAPSWSLAAPASSPSHLTTHRPFTQVAAYSNVVARIQGALNEMGYDAGPVDGFMGNKTRQAIRAYQRNNELLVTGQPSQGLLDHVTDLAASGGRARQTVDTDTEQDRTLRRLQRRLSRLGYDVEATGRMDAGTREAIRAYQRDNKLLVTGESSSALFEHVRESIRKRRRAARQGGTQQSGAQAEASASVIADIQTGLRLRGYGIDAVDGRVDDKTRAAIRDYQRRRGVEVTGEPSNELAAMLREGREPDLDDRESVRRVQQALNARGYSTGPADGVMGPSTRLAIRDYQRRNNIQPTGTVTKSLVQSLGVDTSTSAQDSGPQSPEAVPYERRISDDFSDGDYTSNPAWRVLAGSFTVVSGALRSSVTGRLAEKDFREELLRGILGQALGVSMPGRSGAAGIVQATPFANAFEISIAMIGAPDDRARVNLGPYQGQNAAHGYRLVYDSSNTKTLTLTAVGDDGERIVASTSAVPRLGDGKQHRLQWNRDSQGLMVVSVDGIKSLEVRDRSFDENFDGFSLINAGGDWRIEEVVVSSR